MNRRAAPAGAVAALLLAACAAAPPAVEGPLFEGKPLSHYLAEIRDLSPERKAHAANALEHFGEAAAPAIPDLVDALRIAEIERPVSDALIAIGPSSLPAVLSAMTTSPSPEVRDRASFVVAVFIERGTRSPEILDAIGRGLDDIEGAARWSANAVGDLGPDAAPFIPRLEVLAKGKGYAADWARDSLKSLRAGK